MVVFLFQLTIAERSVVVYATMVIPMVAWLIYCLTIFGFCAITKRWALAATNVVSLLVIVFGIGAYSFGTPSDKPTDLRIMTLNVQLFRDFTMEAVAEAIIRENPDVVCLQELPKDGKAQQFANLFEGYELAHDRRLGILSKHPIKHEHSWDIGTRGRYVLAAEITLGDKIL